MHCPLCLSARVAEFTEDSLSRCLYKCENCEGIFVGEAQMESGEKEKARYLTHNNTIENKGYVDFLLRAVIPAEPYLNTVDIGLDYGSGPKPVLTEILEQKGYQCEAYDFYFQPQLPQKQYDFIFSTETFEHFKNPRKELDTLCKLLVKGGILVIMTQPYTAQTNFKKWYYAGDFTHVFFYHSQTMEYIAREFGFKIINRDEKRGVWVMRLNDQ